MSFHLYTSANDIVSCSPRHHRIVMRPVARGPADISTRRRRRSRSSHPSPSFAPRLPVSRVSPACVRACFPCVLDAPPCATGGALSAARSSPASKRRRRTSQLPAPPRASEDRAQGVCVCHGSPRCCVQRQPRLPMRIKSARTSPPSPPSPTRCRPRPAISRLTDIRLSYTAHAGQRASADFQ